MKVCSRCKQEYSKDMFNKDKRRKDGLTYHCKSCVSYYSNKVSKETRHRQSTEYRQKNPDKARQYWIKGNYNLSWNEYTTLLKNQENACAICYKPLKLHKGIDLPIDVACVDHCHTTGRIRGLLCSHCNSAIGLLKEDKRVLKRIVKYLGD